MGIIFDYKNNMNKVVERIKSSDMCKVPTPSIVGPSPLLLLFYTLTRDSSADSTARGGAN